MITIDLMQEILGWCIVLDICLLLWWMLIFTLARDRVLALHRRWFKIAPEHFDTILYGAIGLFKLGALLFHVIPYLALLLAGRS